MKNGPHTYGQCRFCTEYHSTYPVLPSERNRQISEQMMQNGLSAIVALHHVTPNGEMKDFGPGHPATPIWRLYCCECEQEWPCPTYDIATRALGFEQPGALLD